LDALASWGFAHTSRHIRPKRGKLTHTVNLWRVTQVAAGASRRSWQLLHGGFPAGALQHQGDTHYVGTV
jgi:hypothetical protein